MDSHGSLNESLQFLHPSGSSFFVLSTPGIVYTVTISAVPTCNCPDQSFPCKHILFVFMQALGVSLYDPCLGRRTLNPSQVRRLLELPTSQAFLASDAIPMRFFQMFSDKTTSCPICLEEMKRGEKLVPCEICKNLLHKLCFMRWKTSIKNKASSFMICRAPRRDENENYNPITNGNRYMNLALCIVQEYYSSNPSN